MNGGYQSMHMGQMAHASMIGAQGPMYGGGQTMGEAGFAGGVSKMGAVAGPAAGLGLAVMGMDPVSIGMKAAWGARGAGMLGAGAAGLAAAAPLAIGLAGAQYVGGQMMTGMQQQQQFNSMMRSNYGYLGGPTGQGMDTGTLGGMGQMMRQMAFNVGPQGQMTNFDELGRLAANMGRMGMTQGVTDAREFSEKFKKMVGTLKEISKHLGTSLEEAQKMMGSMKQSGIFGMGNQAAAIQGMAGVSRATGMATSEVSGMMGIGSQIARMTGGRGRHGALAGLQAASMLGTATKMGVLSEEDIYDVTGQTGAEGRQAFAANMLQGSARFLQGNLGRRAVAAMMGPGGGLNEEAVEEFMMGGVGTGRTMQLAHQNIAKMGGQAAFMRNEGRARGQIMSRFGGLAPAVIMRGWLQQRGMDVEDDRSMLFMQQRLGMGRDEADQMMKMVRELPRIMQARAHMGQRAQEEAEFSRMTSERQGRTGMQGLKRKFETARAKVQQTLQQVGADIMESGSDMLDRFINRLTGNYVERYERDAMTLYQSAIAGGPQGDIIAQNYFGVGGKNQAFDRFKGAQQKIFGGDLQQRRGLFAGTGSLGMGASLALGGATGGAFAALEGALFSTPLEMEQQRYKEAGFGHLAAAGSQEQLRSRLGQLRGMHTQMLTGGKGLEDAAVFRKLGSQFSDDFKMSLASGRIFGAGRTRVETFGTELMRMARKDPKYRELSQKFMNAKPEEKAAMMANTLGGAGALAGEHQMFDAPNMLGVIGGAQWASARERQIAIGTAFKHGPEEAMKMRQQAAAAGAGGMALDVLGGVTALFSGNLVGAGAAATKLGLMPGGEDVGGVEAAAIGRYLETQAGRDLTYGALGGSEAQQRAVRGQLQDRAAQLRRKGKGITRDEQAELDVAQGLLYAQDSKKFMRPDGSVNKEALREYARANGKTPEQIMNMVRTVGAVALEGQDTRLRQVARTISAQAGRTVQGLQQVGTLEGGPGGQLRLSADFSEQLGGIGQKNQQGQTDAQIFVQSMVDLQLSQSKMTGDVKGEQADRRLFEEARSAYGRGEEALGRMGVAERRALAKSMRGKGMAAERGRIMRGVELEERMTKADGTGLRRFGALGVMAASMGATFKKGEFEKMFVKKGEFQLGGDADAAEAIIQRMGFSEQTLAQAPGIQDQMKAIVQASRTGQPVNGRTAVQMQEDFMKQHGQALSRDRVRQQDPVKADMAEGIAKMVTSLDGLPDKMAAAMKNVKITVINKDAEAKDDDGGGGGGGGTCFTGEAKVRMADGSEKPISEIREGDEVVSVGDDGKLTTSKVTEIVSHITSSDMISINGLLATVEHPIKTSEGWKVAGDLKLGDRMESYEEGVDRPVGTKVMEISRLPLPFFREVKGPVMVYDFKMDEHHNYFADGILSFSDYPTRFNP